MKKGISGSGLRKIENYFKRNNARQKIQAHRSVEQAANDLASHWRAKLIVTGNQNAGGQNGQ
jgi:hypothetical protein